MVSLSDVVLFIYVDNIIYLYRLLAVSCLNIFFYKLLLLPDFL